VTVQSIPVHEAEASDYPEVYDGQGQRLGVLENAFAVMVTETLITPPDASGAATGSETLTFLIPQSDPKRDLLENERRVRVAGSEFVVRQVVDGWDNMQSMSSQAIGMSRWMSDNMGSSGAGVVTTMVTAEAAWYDLAACDPIPSLALTAVGAYQAIVTVLQGTGWTFAGTDIKQPNSFSLGQPTTVLAALRLIQQTWGGELEFDSISKTAGLWQQRGSFQQLVYAYRHNLAGNTRTLDTETLATRAWPYGAGNLGIEKVNGGTPFIEDYSFFDSRGWPRETRAVPLLNDQLTDPNQLLAWAKAQLALLSQPKPTYELAVAQLPGDPVPGIGDTVTVDDVELDLRTQPRVVQRVLDVLQPENTQLQLANTLPSLPTASNPAVGGAPAPVSSNGSMVLGDGSGNQSGQSFSTAPQGSNPNVWMDAAGVHATNWGGGIVFNLSAVTGILTAQAVLQEGSNVPAPVITSQLTDAQLQALQTAKLTGQITTTQITDSAISTPKLAAGAVTTANLAAFAVVAGTIASGTITSAQIAANTIVGGNIAASSIGADRLSVGSLSAISANLGTVTAGTINGVTINGSAFNFPTGSLGSGGLSLDTTNATGSTGYGVTFNDGGTLGGYLQMVTGNGSVVLAQVERNSTVTVGTHILATASGSYNATLVNGVNGSASFPGTVYSNGTALTSDARLKSEVESFGPALTDVRRLRAVSYRPRHRSVHEQRLRIGLVAQEVESVFPRAAVRHPETGNLALDPMALTAVLVEAVKDLAARVDELTDSYVTGHPMLTLSSTPADG
jgi:phage minor structural protein